MNPPTVPGLITLADIDVTFDASSDTPPGKDPDRYSPTLRTYHRLLWSKPLPDGWPFTLTAPNNSVYLQHESARGLFQLSSDSITNDNPGPMSYLQTEDSLPRIAAAKGPWGWTIAACMVFPGFKVSGKQTINQHRGTHPRIKDRFDLTLECIRRHYLGMESPLGETLGRYSDFFALFRDFAGYCEFFFLQDLVEDDGTVRFYLPFDDFTSPALPRDLDSYLVFLRAQAAFEAARAVRIDSYVRPRRSA